MFGDLHHIRPLPRADSHTGLNTMTFLRLRDVRVEFPLYQGGNRSLKKTILARMRSPDLKGGGRDELR